ncbi:MAG TPA: ParB/RepB/Spo0J family partition protein [Fimbriimonadaceae bacterium]|nr:ParB/RepB/Spo0J family partition protein [Fimbriimonadaceae bacterium]
MRRALGKGLSQLIGEQADGSPAEVPLDSIVPNQRQPRTHFAEDALQELAASIREVGVLQPLVVKPVSEGRFELIAGERRLRAARLAGLRTVPVIVRPAGAQSSLEMALIENIQREDISPLECAHAYRRLIDEFHLTQEQVAEKVGKSRAGIANTLRLLRLPPRVLEGLASDAISEGHAKALLSLDSPAQQLAVYDQILQRGLTVRDVEKVAGPKSGPKSRRARTQESRDPNLGALEQALSERLGTPVKIRPEGETGRVEISYYSEADLQRLLDILGIQL